MSAALLFVLLSLAIVLGARDLWRPCIRGDGVGYYAPLASWLVDRDLDLRNELGHLNPRYLQAAFMTPDGRLGDPFPIGPALLWLPAVVVVQSLPPSAPLDAPLLESPQTPHPAFAPRFVRALLGADLILVVLGGSLLVAALATTCGVGRAVAAGIVGIFGTPVVFYTLADPSYGHAASFAVTAVFVAAVWRDRNAPLPLACLGFLWGLVALVRAQDAVLGLLLAPRLLDLWRSSRRLQLWQFFAPALVAFLPQMLFWQRIYGQLLLVPPGPDLGAWWKPHVFHLLFSTWNGLLPWAPLVALGLGCLWFVCERPLRWAMWGAAVLVLYSSALLLDWWGGNAFGPRRLVSLVPLAVIGLTHALGGGRRSTMLLGFVFALAIAVNLRVAEYKMQELLPGNPGNAADYVRHYTPGTQRTFPYRHLDYARLIAENLEAERMLRLRKSRSQ